MIAAMDLTKLTAQLELGSSFAQRQKLVAGAARGATPSDLKEIARLLNHRVDAVRLGAIEILEAARFRPVLGILAQATRKRRGDERVLAARAVAALAAPGDRATLEPVARGWLESQDEILHIHAHALLEKLGAAPAQGQAAQASPAAITPAPASAAGDAVPGFGITAPDRDTRARVIAQTLAHPEAEHMLGQGLLDSKHPGVRVDLLQALERLGAERVAGAAPRLLGAGDGDIVALVARALSRHIPALAQARLTPVREALQRARGRLRGHALATAALDECLLATEADSAIEVLAAQVDALEVDTVRRVAAHLEALPPERRRPFLPRLIESLAHAPRRALLFAEVLREAWPTLRPPQRQAVRGLLADAGATGLPRGLPADALAAIGALYAVALAPGDTAPAAVLDALDRHDEPAVLQAAIAIHAALATEDAARRLAVYLEEPDAAVREAARQALRGLDAAHVKVTFGEDGAATVSPDYRTPAGAPLTASRGALTAADGTRYVLDARGEPLAESDTDWGGCRCCERPRALARQGKARPTCPMTGEPHLVEDGKPMLERSHPLGGCGVCESLGPLVRQGPAVRCETCQTEHVEAAGRYQPRRKLAPARARDRAADSGPGALAPDVPVGPIQRRDLPEPPGPDELKLVEPAIARAMAANVFILGTGVEQQWTGSGVIVARSGSDVAILTNRHVIEDADESGRVTVAGVRVYTISGELVPARVLWRASRGLDLALLSVTLERPALVGITELQDGACMVGSRLFAIGNPLGLSWSYSSGTLAAFRNWSTPDGLAVRFIQSHVSMSHGSSGGGLYHEQGHLVGINTFLQGNIVGPGGDQSFSIAMPSVIEALRRERVSFAGTPLAK